MAPRWGDPSGHLAPWLSQIFFTRPCPPPPAGPSDGSLKRSNDNGPPKAKDYSVCGVIIDSDFLGGGVC